MIQRIEAIRKCITCGCYDGALALALTLPDICGQVKYPNKDKVGDRYTSWIRNCVNREYFNFPISGFESQTFDELMCYQLRNHFLHSGDIDISIEKKNLIDSFEMDISEGEYQLKGYQYIESSGRLITRIGVVYLCNCLCDEAESFYNNWPNKTDFDTHTITYINRSLKSSASEDEES